MWTNRTLFKGYVNFSEVRRRLSCVLTQCCACTGTRHIRNQPCLQEILENGFPALHLIVMCVFECVCGGSHASSGPVLYCTLSVAGIFRCNSCKQPNSCKVPSFPPWTNSCRSCPLRCARTLRCLCASVSLCALASVCVCASV